MKSILVAAALASGLAVPLTAMAYSPDQLSKADQREVHRLVPGADLSHLTPQQVSEIETALYGSGPKAAAIRAALK